MWHLGCINAGCLNKLGYDITCFDFDENVIDNLSRGKLPIYENGLQELFTSDIHYTKNISDVSNSDFVFITYDISANGIELNIIDKIIEQIKPYITNQIIVVRSQITVGTCEKIKRELNCEVCYIPENIRLGTALDTFFHPDWLIFGISSETIKTKIDALFIGINTKKVFMKLEEAEMVKLAMNSYLATMISFSGEISDLCEKYNINAKQVLSSLKLDRRVSEYAPISPGLGFSGATIQRDLSSIQYLGRTKVLSAVDDFNSDRVNYITKKLESLLYGYLNGRVITFFGVTYKKGTNTLRDSPIIKITRSLRKKGAFIKVYDPLVGGGIPGVTFIQKTSEARNSDAVVIMTDYDEFKTVNYQQLNVNIILDTKGILPSSIKHYEVGINE